MSEALAAWNGYVFDRPRSGRLAHQRVEHSRRLAHGQRDLGCGERCALGDHARAATRRSIRLPPYLDPHERATENAARRTERGAPNPGVRPRARRWSGESGGSEGLASATTDNRPMSIESIAHQPRVPQPPSPRGNRR